MAWQPGAAASALWRRPGSVGHPAGSVGPGGNLDPVAYPELRVDRTEVGFDGAERDEQLGGNLGVGQTASDRAQHVLFPGGERLGRLYRGTGAWLAEMV